MGALPVSVISDARRAAALLGPLRLRVLAGLRQPDSAAGVARRLRLPRQKVNYHVRALARAGYLRRAGHRRVRSMIEQRYVATARGYVLAPQVLGELAADRGQVEDAFSAAYLLALTSEAQRDLARVMELAAAQGKRVATLSISTRMRFVSPGQRAEFARALQRAIVDVVGRYASPDRAPDGGAAPGHRFRLVLGVYPAPPADSSEGRAKRPAQEAKS
jgi:hypothetical protein